MTGASLRSLAGLVLLVTAVSGASAWWREHRAGLLGEQLAALARPGDIVMLSSVTCVFCERARRWMTQQKVPFAECFIEHSELCARRYEAAGARGTPTLLVRGQPQWGFDAENVLSSLTRAP